MARENSPDHIDGKMPSVTVVVRGVDKKTLDCKVSAPITIQAGLTATIRAGTTRYQFSNLRCTDSKALTNFIYRQLLVTMQHHNGIDLLIT